MVRQTWFSLAAASVSAAASLSDVCTTSHVQSSIPANGTFPGLTFHPDTVTASVAYNQTYSSSDYPSAAISYCNVTFTYSHDGWGDNVIVQYWLPDPAAYQNRFLATGGGGYAISSGSRSLPGGVIYGAASGTTDGGYGGFSSSLDNVVLLANGSINWHAIHMQGYQAIHEMTLIGKSLSGSFYSTDNKIYTYYQGCSEGGREGWSQAQRFGQDYDGIIAGAPAFRYSHLQVGHLSEAVMQQTLGYSAPPCELEKIINETIAFCDPLDGKTDGVISRSDLCKLKFDVNSTIGLSYYCEASGGSGPPSGASKSKVKRQFPGGGSPQPEQNGTVTAEAAALAQTILDGLHDSQGRQAYLSPQPGASFADARTTYDNATGTWALSIPSIGGEFVTKFLQFKDEENLSSLDGITYDTLVDWMNQAIDLYEDTLQTTNPDLSGIREAGGKILHFHGEQDSSIAAGSSVHYYESVRGVMYPDQSFNESVASLSDFYRLYLVPGAEHCGPNSAQANGPWPNTNLAVMIDWVENGVAPDTLNSTVLQGEHAGDSQQLCAWPLRPVWRDDGAAMVCEYDQASIDSWMYTFDAFDRPIY
ncbi:hypothetical protein SLS62_010573 [Diatrype stigma]|uniref:Carboxylic ester hydrolase n=1 Tax=Diatrype stigma TaxID=117547 RepID=A0AAN9UG00_9PEZI